MISGFMSGIGVIIIVIQVMPFIGLDTVSGGPLNSIRAWPEAFGDLSYKALILGAISLGVGIFWPARLRKFLPGPLAALIAGTVAALFWLKGVPTIGERPHRLFPIFRYPQLSPGFIAGVLEPAFILALLGSIDSLLTSLVADSLTRTRHNPNRELMGQGFGQFCVRAWLEVYREQAPPWARW